MGERISTVFSTLQGCEDTPKLQIKNRNKAKNLFIGNIMRKVIQLNSKFCINSFLTEQIIIIIITNNQLYNRYLFKEILLITIGFPPIDQNPIIYKWEGSSLLPSPFIMLCKSTLITVELPKSYIAGEVQ